MSMSESILREKAIGLMGDQHMNVEQTAAVLGVTPGRISQFMSEAAFSEAVATKKVATLQEATKRDRAYDKLEDTVLVRLKQSLDMTVGSKPRELASILAILNNAKRRGVGLGETPKSTTNLATITLPSNIALQFTMNVHNQVIQVTDGKQDTNLVTLQTHKIKELTSLPSLQEIKEITHDNPATNASSEPKSSQASSTGLGQLKSFLATKSVRRRVDHDNLDL